MVVQPLKRYCNKSDMLLCSLVESFGPCVETLLGPHACLESRRVTRASPPPVVLVYGGARACANANAEIGLLLAHGIWEASVEFKRALSWRCKHIKVEHAQHVACLTSQVTVYVLVRNVLAVV